jgi:hypothetical protein
VAKGVTNHTAMPVPDMPYLAQLYRKAITAKDARGAQIAESAALTFARGEAAIAEAVIMTQFLAHGDAAKG